MDTVDSTQARLEIRAAIAAPTPCDRCGKALRRIVRWEAEF